MAKPILQSMTNLINGYSQNVNMKLFKVLSIPTRVMIIVVLIFVAILTTGLHLDLPTEEAIISSTPTDGLLAITLIYGKRAGDSKLIEHNCEMIRNTNHRYIIYTDNLRKRFCRKCQCIRYRPFNCKCPGKGKCVAKNPCEKLFFYVWAIQKWKQFVFLDSDLTIMKPFFLDRLYARSRAHDFLATYKHASINSTKYQQDFNSGLFFIRYKKGIDYDWLKRTLYENKSGFDQNILSRFIHKFYSNWDTLSWKWHCRMLLRTGQDMHPNECYTLHDRTDSRIIRKQLKFKLKKSSRIRWL